MGEEPRKVALVDDHGSLLLGLRAVLTERCPGVTVVAVSETVDDALVQPVDLVVLDLKLQDGSDPVANIERIRAAGADVLVYTSGEDPVLLRKAARANVLGIVRKSQPVTELVAAVECAARGGTVANSDWAAAIDSDPALPAVGLSPQEERILELYASGESQDRVARLMKLSPETVSDYVKRIRVKYAANGRPAPTKVDLYKRAVEDGILPVPART